VEGIYLESESDGRQFIHSFWCVDCEFTVVRPINNMCKFFFQGNRRILRDQKNSVIGVFYDSIIA